jgi:hypothetical protein
MIFLELLLTLSFYHLICAERQAQAFQRKHPLPTKVSMLNDGMFSNPSTIIISGWLIPPRKKKNKNIIRSFEAGN